MSKSSDSSVSFGVGLLFGVLMGVAAGILYTPKSGQEMRQDLMNFTDKITDNLNPELDTAKNASLDMVNKVRYSFEKQFNKINEAVKAGRMAAAKRKEELESGYNY